MENTNRVLSFPRDVVIRGEAGDPRLMGRWTPWMGGPAPMAVTYLDEAGDPIYTYIENIFNSDYLQSKEKPA